MARGYVGGPPPHDHTRACRLRSPRGGHGYTTGHALPRSLSCPKLTDEADLPTVNNVPMLGRLKFANTDSGSLSALSQWAYQGSVVLLDAGTCSVDTKRSCLTGDACSRFTARFWRIPPHLRRPSYGQSVATSIGKDKFSGSVPSLSLGWSSRDVIQNFATWVVHSQSNSRRYCRSKYAPQVFVHGIGDHACDSLTIYTRLSSETNSIRSIFPKCRTNGGI